MVQFINEIWKPITINPVYLVSNYGRVRTIDHPVWSEVNKSYSIRKGRMCIQSNKNSKKYWRVGIQLNNKQKQFAVHRLVALAFIPNPKNYDQINHKDGNKNNNFVTNLEWCDNSYNIRHALENGLISREKQSKNSFMRKLSYEQVVFIRQIYAKYKNEIDNKNHFCNAIIRMFNLKSKNTVRWILENGTNKFINQDIVQTTNFNCWETEFKNLLESLRRPKTRSDWARELNVNISSFNGRYVMFNKDLEKTIKYFLQLKANENQSGKENFKT